MFRNRFLTGMVAGAIAGLALTMWLVPSRRNVVEAAGGATGRQLGGGVRRVAGSVRQGVGDWLKKG